MVTPNYLPVSLNRKWHSWCRSEDKTIPRKIVEQKLKIYFYFRLNQAQIIRQVQYFFRDTRYTLQIMKNKKPSAF